MVINDFSEKPQAATLPTDPKPQWHLAHTVDRVTSFFIDVILLSPLMGFAFAPFYRLALEAYLKQQTGSAFLVGAVGIIVCLVIGFLYFVITLFRFERTFGQKLWHLKREKNDGSAFSLKDSFELNFFLALNLLTFGLLSFSSLTDLKKRCLQDRFTDSRVVTLKIQKSDFRRDQLLKRAAWGMVFIFASTYVVPASYVIFRKTQEAFVRSEKSTNTCSNIEKLLGTLESSSMSRLDLALSLFAAGSLTEDCLSKEVDFSLWADKESELAYLGKAFSESSDVEKSDLYLKKVCEVSPVSASCKLSSIIQNWVSLPKHKITTELKNLMKESEVFVQVWGIRHFLAEGDFETAIQQLNKLEDYPQFGLFIGESKIKALMGLNKVNDAELYFKAMYPHLKAENQSQISAVYCSNQLEKGCDSLNKNHCGRFLSEINHLKVNEIVNESLVVWAKAQSCSSVQSLQLSENSKLSVEMLEFQKAIEYEKRGQVTEALEAFHNLALEGVNEKDILGLESVRHLVHLEDDAQVLTSEVATLLIKASKKGPRWQTAIKELSIKLFDIGAKEDSYALAQEVRTQFDFLSWPLLFRSVELFEDSKVDLALEEFEKAGDPWQAVHSEAESNLLAESSTSRNLASIKPVSKKEVLLKNSMERSSFSLKILQLARRLKSQNNLKAKVENSSSKRSHL